MKITENVYPSDGIIDVRIGYDYCDKVHRVSTDTETGIITITPNRVAGLLAVLDFGDEAVTPD